MKFCLLGKTLSHSYSEVLHKATGADYVLKELKEDELGDFFKDCPFDGFNVTIPYKKAVTTYLASVSEVARRAGAVNTVLKRDGKFYGYNTDYYGVIGTFKRYGVDVKGKKALVLGTGGAANVVALALKDMGAKKVDFVSRTGEINYENCYSLEDTEILVNATPVGTFPDLFSSPVDLSRFKNLSFVFDLIYNPSRTALLCRAKELNIPFANGLTMLAVQAIKSREIWEKSTYSEAFVEKAIDILNDRTLNIALIGMPSCGKSTIARMLAEKLEKSCFDTDDEVEKACGRTPEDIIISDGEGAFREIEARAVRKICEKKGVVISLGGGAVTYGDNAEYLKRTSMVVYIKRDLDKLVSKGRPLSMSEGVENLYGKRAPVYESAADVVVTNNASLDDAVKEIIKAYENFGR